MENCKLCETRKPRRFCPAVNGDICSQCCGSEREVTVDCPLDCEHLMEARKHEKLATLAADQIPHPDVRVTESFIDSHNGLVVLVARALLTATFDTPGAVDTDVREGVDALIRTYKTAASGLIYETHPANPYADAIRQRLDQALEQVKEHLRQQAGMHVVRPSDVLAVLVFLARLERQRHNGRRRGRAFLSSLLSSLPQQSPSIQPSIVSVP
jgi:hypothetical protein